MIESQRHGKIIKKRTWPLCISATGSLELLLDQKKQNSEGNDVSLEAIRDFIAHMWTKYQSTMSKILKSQYLDAVCTVLGIHRKSAIRLMNNEDVPLLRKQSGSNEHTYSPGLIQVSKIQNHV